MNFLHVLVPLPGHFYSLYYHGSFTDKQTVKDGTVFSILPGTLAFVYYTYPTHRRAFAVRYTSPGRALDTLLPGFSCPVKILLRCHASKIDKLKKAVSFLSTHFSENPFTFTDEFYIRLHFIIQQRGKIDYEKIRALYAYLKSANRLVGTRSALMGEKCQLL